METLIDDIRHFFSCVNYAESAIDSDATQFMNDFAKRVEYVYEQGRLTGYAEGFEAGEYSALHDADKE